MAGLLSSNAGHGDMSRKRKNTTIVIETWKTDHKELRFVNFGGFLIYPNMSIYDIILGCYRKLSMREEEEIIVKTEQLMCNPKRKKC